MDKILRMKYRRIVAFGAIGIWLIALGFVSGPARWEFAHTYEIWIKGFEKNLPELTTVLALPLLEIGESSALSIFLSGAICAIAWLGPVVLLVGVWRAPNREALSDWLLYGGALYASLMALFVALIAVSFWLPFGFL